MNALIFSCPKTEQPIDVGLDIAVRSLQDVQPITIRLVCPLCHAPHVWKLADGWIREPRATTPLGEWRAL